MSAAGSTACNCASMRDCWVAAHCWKSGVLVVIIAGKIFQHAGFEHLDLLLGVRELVISERALREGLIVDWMLRNDLIVDRFAFQSSIRQRTVLHQVQLYGVDQARAERVAGYALSLYGQTRGLLHDKVMAMLEQFRLVDRAGEHASALSHGQQQWLEIAMALATRPKMLLLDEARLSRDCSLNRRQISLREIQTALAPGIRINEHPAIFTKHLVFHRMEKRRLLLE